MGPLDTPIRSDFFQVNLRFPRLFPDPAFFEDQIHLANRVFRESGISKDREDLVYQITDEIVPLDDRGKPAVTSGTAKYEFEGRTILAEYMNNAIVRVEYLDFGSGLSPNDHTKIWNRGRLGGLRFELREFKHHPQSLNMPEISEMYRILKERAAPKSLSTIELENIPGKMFSTAITFLGDKLRSAARVDDLEVEIYAAKDLSPSEKNALETRLGRQSGNSTVFVILNQKS
jgi:hypothetical protein